MKKILIILGAVFAFLIVLAVVGISIVAVKGSALDRDSKAYVDETVPKILADLTRETLFEYASEELKDSASPEDFDKVFRWFTKLGEFREYKGSTGQAHIMYTTQSGKSITATYSAQADFETGPVAIEVGCIKKQDGWFIQLFRINSPALIGE